MAKAKKTQSPSKSLRKKQANGGKAALASGKPAGGAGGPAQHAAMDRRGGADRRGAHDRRTHNEPVPVERRKLQRRVKVPRRRQIDPTTCERDYSEDEVEFMNALDEYKRASGRMFPTCSEVLEVIRNLGYAKGPPATEPAPNGDPPAA